MGKARSLKAAWGVIAVALLGCESLIGADFDRDFDVWQPGDDCLQTCPEGEECNRQLGTCQCAPLGCEVPGQPSQQCGGVVEARCGHAIYCGVCPEGQECTNAGGGAPNQCTPIVGVPCRPQTCQELGQTSGVHFSCGVLVDCNPLPACNGACSNDEVCTSGGCCKPNPPKGKCGQFPDGCGRVVDVACAVGFCMPDGSCCSPTAQETRCVDSMCGLNPTSCPDVYTECVGACESGECLDATHPFCAPTCTGRKCPEGPAALCGLNDDGCGGMIQCHGACPKSGDVCSNDFRCCTPRCPTTPTTCGLNDNGCGGKIQCPGACPAGNSCRPANDGTFSCLP